MPEHPPVVATQITDSPHFDPQRFYVVRGKHVGARLPRGAGGCQETAAEKLSQMAQWPHASTFTANQAKLAESCLRLQGCRCARRRRAAARRNAQERHRGQSTTANCHGRTHGS